MILAEKIIKLRKQLGWSQEELAEKLAVSRQSVSKWESANSIPDLNKIIKLAEIFDVSTDFLLKDENEVYTPKDDAQGSDVHQVSLEQATRYVEQKLEVSDLITKGVMLCLCSVMPLFFFLAMAETGRLSLTSNTAVALGIACIVGLISYAVSFFIQSNQYEDETAIIDDEPFELAYGVHSVFQEKLKKFRATYNSRLSIGVFLFIVSFLPLMFVAMFAGETHNVLMMLIVMLFIIAGGIYVVVPVSAKFDAYNNVLKEASLVTEKSKRTERAEQLAAFYWPLLTAVYLGWSLWTMNWGVTWIVWPVGGVLFAALVGLAELLNKEDK